jgi:hypothetical protein
MNIKEALDVIVNISTPIGIIGLIVTLTFFSYYRYLKGEEKRLKLLPENKRIKVEDIWLKRLGLELGDLNGEQKASIVFAEIDRKANLTKNLIFAPSVMVILDIQVFNS